MSQLSLPQKIFSWLLVVLMTRTLACSSGTSDGDDSDSNSSNGGGMTDSENENSDSGGSDAPGGATPRPPGDVCAPPEFMEIPATSSVVGDGTAATCTDTAVRQALADGGHITFDCGDTPITIVITEMLQANTETVIDGGGKITFDGAGKVRIIRTGDRTALSLRNLRFVNGALSGPNPDRRLSLGGGGAVLGGSWSRVEIIDSVFEDNRGTYAGGAVAMGVGSKLVVSGSVFSRNASWFGGAIYNLLSEMTIVNSTFTDNFGILEETFLQGQGGAIIVDGASESPDDDIGGEIALCGVTIKNNKAFGTGGGAYIWVYPPDNVTIDRTTVEGNEVTDNTRNSKGDGGGLRIGEANDVGNVPGKFVITRSSFLSNRAGGNGGGLYLQCPAAGCEITNSTFYDNSAEAYGGAVYRLGSAKIINNATFVGNTAGEHGGALSGTEGDVITNSVFVDNTAGNQWGLSMHCTEGGAGSHVLQWSTTKDDAGGNDCVPEPLVANPRLAMPTNNGGPTWTMLPTESSPALRAGANCEPYDQRGTERAAACTLGAVEVP